MEKCEYWDHVQPDQGPHLGRLPDELLPAIGKFIIVASDSCQREVKLYYTDIYTKLSTFLNIRCISI